MWDPDWRRLCQEGQIRKVYDIKGLEGNFADCSGYAPARLTAAAFAKQMSSYNMPQGMFKNAEAWMGAVDIIVQALMPLCGGFEVLSEEQAFDGDTEIGLEPVPMDTSGGAGLSHYGDSKRDILRHPVGNVVFFDELRLDWSIMVGDEHGNLIKPLRLHFSKESEKDEKRDWERVAEEKTRVMTPSSFVETVNGRRIIGHFCAKFMKAAASGYIEPKPGFNMSRGGWHNFLEQMFFQFMEIRSIDADVRKFDKNFPLYMFFWIAYIIAKLAGGSKRFNISVEHHQRMVMRLFWKLSCTPGICQIFGTVFVKSKSMPSGWLATVIVNSICLWLIYAYAYCCKVDKSLWTIGEMRKRVNLCFLGDDNGVVQHPQWNVFGETIEEAYEYIQSIFMELGPWELTLPRADGSFASVEQFSFAGYYSQYVEDMGMLIPRLPYERVLAIMELYRKIPKTEPADVVKLARYDAALEKCFPFLWSKEVKERNLCVMIWIARNAQLKKMLVSNLLQDRAAANGSPGLRQIAELYFGKYLDEEKILPRIFEMPLFHHMARIVDRTGQGGSPIQVATM